MFHDDETDGHECNDDDWKCRSGHGQSHGEDPPRHQYLRYGVEVDLKVSGYSFGQHRKFGSRRQHLEAAMKDRTKAKINLGSFIAWSAWRRHSGLSRRDILYGEALLRHEQKQASQNTRRGQAEHMHERWTDKRQYASGVKEVTPALLVDPPDCLSIAFDRAIFLLHLHFLMLVVH